VDRYVSIKKRAVKDGNSRGLTCVVVVEEGVMPCTIDYYILGIDDTQAPRFSAVAGLVRAGAGKVGVIECRVDCEWRWGGGIGLVISSVHD
jgi:hypothetical protein